MRLERELSEVRNKITEICDRTDVSTHVDELQMLKAKLKHFREKEKDLEGQMAGQPREGNAGNGGGFETRTPGPIGDTQILGTYGLGTGQASGTGDAGAERRELLEKYEQRAADLKAGRPVTFSLNELGMMEQRSILLSGGTVVTPKHTSPTLNQPFAQVSALVDLVDSPVLMGGESYAKGFVKGYTAGDYTTEGQDYNEAEPEHDFVETGKTLVTAYGEISNQVLKLSAADYNLEMIKAMRGALRMKLSREIVAGDGGSGHLTGIFNAPEKVIPAASDVGISEIGADTLDDLVFGYGGDEAVEGGLWLILNRKDLAAFNALRSSDGSKKLYKITIDENGQTGTISSDESFAVRWVINSACKAISDSGTVAGDWSMALGKPMGYVMPQFSDLVVEVAREFKFKQGLVAYRGEAYFGGTPASWKIFTRVKKDT